MVSRDMVVGVDFDNTIVSYDSVMHRAAVEMGLIGEKVPLDKRSVRDAIRQRVSGERDWQRLQAAVYGSYIEGAGPAEGVIQFFEQGRSIGIKVYVVSHKSQFAAAAGEDSTNLRTAAKEWMSKQGFFDPQGLGMAPDDVFFEETRGEKIDRITRLGCTHFIDDLVETFLDPSWPSRVERILYRPRTTDEQYPGIKIFADWKAICGYLLS